MKRCISSILLVLLMCLCTSNLFAGSTDFYLSVPIVVDRTDGEKLDTTAIGGGVKFSSAENDDELGIALGITAYYPLAVSFTEGSGISTTDVSELYSVPLGLDFLVGADINILRLGFLSFPLNVGVHSKVDFYEAGPKLNMGLAGTVGGQLNLGPLGLFARAQISYDFYGTQYIKGEGWNGGKMNHWGIQPQIGVNFSF
ncbi:MAG: hypothetical protein J6V57_02555 [Spirochaetaceae bacterium]|nr:hypothetical protein [Spirochaetaceae bacterium]